VNVEHAEGKAFDEEFSKFERKERAFRQAERDERGAKLRLPIDRDCPHEVTSTRR
jgi:hypothetical protein